MTNIEEIIITANRIANEGRKPSVALVKGRLSQATPLPLIISTLKTWQHQPEYINAHGQSDNKKSGIEDKKEATDLEQAIALAIEPLIQEINQLKEEVAKLKLKLN